MDEHVLIADRGLDEPITLCRVEPLDGAFLHRLSPGLDVKKTRLRILRATPQAAFRMSAQFLSRETHSRTAWIRLRAGLQHEIYALASFCRGLEIERAAWSPIPPVAAAQQLSLIHISEPTRLGMIS